MQFSSSLSLSLLFGTNKSAEIRSVHSFCAPGFCLFEFVAERLSRRNTATCTCKGIAQERSELRMSRYNYVGISWDWSCMPLKTKSLIAFPRSQVATLFQDVSNPPSPFLDIPYTVRVFSSFSRPRRRHTTQGRKRREGRGRRASAV